MKRETDIANVYYEKGFEDAIEKVLNIIRSHADNGMTHENVRRTIEEIKNLK